jgi:hypothetical protein
MWFFGPDPPAQFDRVSPIWDGFSISAARTFAKF